MNSTQVFKTLINSLAERNAMPAKFEVAKLGEAHLVNVYNELDSEIMMNSVATGLDKSLGVASLKALTEFFERKAFQEGYDKNVPACMTDRSDGFAAFPAVVGGSRSKARENALNEAIERFVWATWWDNKDIAFECTCKDVQDPEYWGDTQELLTEATKLLSIHEIKIVEPKIENLGDKKVLIVFAEIENGVISGGACGNQNDFKSILFRGVAELIRHGKGVYWLRTQNKKVQTFYEKRLEFFATTEGKELFDKRLSLGGHKKIFLPELAIDQEISHQFDELFSVHRCLFENQPPFVGGKLERFCL